MRTLLVSICCLSLASLAGAAQQQQSEQDNPNPKGKKGQSGQTSQQVVAPTPKVGGKAKYHTQGNVSGAGANVNVPQNATLRTHKGKVSGQTETNVSGQTNVTGKMGKTKVSGQTNVSGQANVTGPLNTQKFHGKHFNLPNQPKPAIQTAKFQAGAHIQGSQNWHGPKYAAFVNYSPVWHDQFWWTSHYHSHIVFVFGGWYFWDAGYWCPAWGYAPNAYYAYDGPIYAGSPEVDPGQVVANVQAALQEQGYYHGDIDGILGPQTRAALADYQVAQGIEPTGLVDEPTLETLGMA